MNILKLQAKFECIQILKHTKYTVCFFSYIMLSLMEQILALQDIKTNFKGDIQIEKTKILFIKSKWQNEF